MKKSGKQETIPVGIDGRDVGFALRANPSRSGDKGDGGVNTSFVVTHALKAEGFDASEDVTGRGVPLVPEIVGTLSDGAHMGGGLTARTHTPDESLRWVAPAVSSKWSKGSGGPAGDECQNLVPVSPGRTRQGGFFSPDEPIAFPSTMSGTQRAATKNLANNLGAENPSAIAFTIHGSDKTVSTATETEVAGSVRTKPPGSIENSSTTAVLSSMAVRRLTPRECERLQGFPDDFTLVKFNGKPACDGPRYKAIGNSMAVPNIEWIGRRIDLVDELVPWGQ